MTDFSIVLIFVLSLCYCIYFVVGDFGEAAVVFYETQQPTPGFLLGSIVVSSSSGEVVYVVGETYGNEVYVSSLLVSLNWGATWSEITQIPCTDILSLATNSSGSFVILACSNGAFISDAYGASWRNATISSTYQSSVESVSISSSGEYIILGQYQGQVFISSNFGYNWTAIPAYVPRDGADSTTSLVSVKVCETGAVMAITFDYGYVWISSNYGVTWMNSTSLSQGCYGNILMSTTGDNLIAVGCYGLEQVWRSQDYGMSWQVGPAYGYWASIASSASGQYMAAVNAITESFTEGSAVYVSSDYGVFWSRIAATGIPVSEDVAVIYLSVAMSQSGQYICAGSSIWIACSNDFGSSSSWSFPLQSLSQPVNSLAMSGSGSIVYAALPNLGIYKSSNYGSTFLLVNNNTAYAWKSVATSASGQVVLIAATVSAVEGNTKLTKGHVWLSTTGGVGAWTVTPVHTGEVVSVSVDYSGQMLAVAACIPGINATIQLSVNGGISWESLPPPAATMNWVTIALDSTGQVIYLITDTLLIYNTSNYGQTWIEQDVKLAVKYNGDGQTYVNTGGFAMNANATIIAAGGQVEEGNIFLYTASNGWTNADIGDDYVGVAAATKNPQQLVASTTIGVYISSDYGAWWYPASIPAGSYGPVASDAAGVNLFAMSSLSYSLMYSTNFESTIFVPTVRPTAPPTSTPNTARPTAAPTTTPTFTYKPSVHPTAYPSAMPTHAFGYDDDVVVSSATFFKTQYPRYVNADQSIFASSADGSVIICAQGGGRVQVSNNYGSDWINRTAFAFSSSTAIAVNSTGEMIVVLNGYGVYVSWNNGITWTDTLQSTTSIWYSVACSSSGQYVAVVEPEFIYISSDYGAKGSWTAPANLDPLGQWASVSMSSSGGVILVGVEGIAEVSGLWMSSDYGATWAPITDSNVESEECFYKVAMSDDGSYMSAWVCYPYGSSAQLYSSSDGGISWTVNTFSALQEQELISYSIATANPAIQVLATDSTLYVSDDFGQTWGLATFSVPSQVYNALWWNVVSNANGDYLLAFNNFDGGLFSTDASAQTHVPTPVPTGSPGSSTVSAGVVAGAVVGSVVGAVALIGGIGYFVTSSSAAAAAGTAATGGATASSVTAVGGAPAASAAVQNPLAASGHDAL